jgi:hypothetical protein
MQNDFPEQVGQLIMHVNGCLNLRSCSLHEQSIITDPPASGATPLYNRMGWVCYRLVCVAW